MDVTGAPPTVDRRTLLPRTLRVTGIVCRYAVWLAGIVLLVVSFTPLVPWWAYKLSGGFGDPRGDVLIVLASSENTDGILGYSSYLRTEYAIRAWREGWVRAIVISGGAEHGPAPSRAMRAFLVANSVPSEVIKVETESTSTRENALYSRAVLQNLPGQAVLLTSDYHMYRALRVFRKAGIAVFPRPFPDAMKRGASIRGRWPAFLDLCSESSKILYYRLRRWI